MGHDADALAAAFAEVMRDTWVVGDNYCVDLIDGSYVQWAKFPIGLVVEVASGRYCTPPRPRTPQQVAELLALGFCRPADEDDAPNFWQVFLSQPDLDAAGSVLARVITEVLCTDVAAA
jgi:hypothetical protein